MLEAGAAKADLCDYAFVGAGCWCPTGQAFEALVQRQAERFFEQLLPRCIDRHYRGRGYAFIRVLLRAHDEDRCDTLGDDGPAQPSKRARKLAVRARVACPLVVETSAQPQLGALVLGLFTRSSSFAGIHELGSTAQVQIFETGFAALSWTSRAALEREVLRTIVHEYIHFFESFLLRREQPLAGREAGWSVYELSDEAARRRDRRALLKRWTVLMLGALLMLAMAAGILVGHRQ